MVDRTFKAYNRDYKYVMGYFDLLNVYIHWGRLVRFTKDEWEEANQAKCEWEALEVSIYDLVADTPFAVRAK